MGLSPPAGAGHARKRYPGPVRSSPPPAARPGGAAAYHTRTGRADTGTSGPGSYARTGSTAGPWRSPASEAFWSHADARLTVDGRLLLGQRVASGRPAAHVARGLGISRQCASRWVRRYAAGGLAGLADRSSRPGRMPRRTAPAVEARVVAARRGLRRGPAFIAQATGVPPRTVSRILRPAGEPRLADCDPLTGQVIRASKATAVRYERDRPGELVHVDVKKLGRIPDGGGWRARGRPGAKTWAAKTARSEEHTSELQSQSNLVCRLLLEKK